MDALWQLMAMQQVTAFVEGTYNGTTFYATGPVIPASNGGVAQINIHP